MGKFCLLLLLLWSVGASASENADIWRLIYTQVPQAYVYDVTPEELAVAALKSLHKVDRKLMLGNDSGRMTLYYRGKVVRVIRKPEERTDVSAWADLSAAFVQSAIEKSSEAAKRDFELTNILAAGLTDVLDKDSKFYGNMDEAEGIHPKNQRMFAARREGDVLYITIKAFNRQTLGELRQAAADHASAKEMILDLRGCPGGMLGEAIKTADLFLDGGIIAVIRGRQSGEEVYYTADEEDVWRNKRLTVWIDEETASAAEVLTAALQEQGRADVVGMKSKGKGSIQKLIVLPGGGVLAVTSGFFMTPSGRELNGQGIVPGKKRPDFYEK